jgi:hypothetical protein
VPAHACQTHCIGNASPLRNGRQAPVMISRWNALHHCKLLVPKYFHRDLRRMNTIAQCRCFADKGTRRTRFCVSKLDSLSQKQTLEWLELNQVRL